MSHNIAIRFDELDFVLDRVLNFNLQHDILNPPYEFTFSFWLTDFAQSNALAFPCQPITILIDGIEMLQGIIHAQTIENDGVVTLSGTDHSYELTDFDLDPALKCNTGDKLMSVVQRLLEPMGYSVVSSFDDARSVLTGVSSSQDSDDPSNVTITKKKTHAGEQIFTTINDLAAMSGFLIVPTTNPFEVALVRPAYNQSLVYNVNNTLPINPHNNVISSELHQDYRRVPTMIQAFGTNHQPDKSKAGTFQNMKLQTILNQDPILKQALGQRAITKRWTKGEVNSRSQSNLTLYRPVFEQDQKHTKAQTELFHLANRHFIEKLKDVYTYTAKLQGWSQAGKYWAPDTLVEVHDAASMIQGDILWVSERSFSYTNNAFTTTIKCMKPSTFALGNIIANSLS